MRYLQGMRGRLERCLWVGAVALGLAVVAVSGWRVAVSPKGLVLPRTADAPWIAAPAPVTAQIHQWGSERVPVVSFVATFLALESAPEDAAEIDPQRLTSLIPRYQLDVRALGDFSLFLNGKAALLATQQRDAPPRDWKRFQSLDVSLFVQPGRNAIRVNVRNPRGPGLLSLRLSAEQGEASRGVLSTGRNWRASLAGDATESGTTSAANPADPATRAVLASDVAPHVSAILGESPLESVRRHAFGIALWFALGAAAFLLWQRARENTSASADRLPLFAGVLVGAGWLYLFVSKFHAIDIAVGFDARSHVAYANWLAERATLPSAADGWAMYHPPLFYLLSAAAAMLAEALGLARETAFKLVPWLSGLVLVVASRALVRRLCPGDSAAEAAAILFAGWLPMNVYLAAYYTNEGFHAALAGLALAAGVGLLVERDPTRRGCALFSLWIGLALLAKFTAIVLAAVLGLAIVIRIGVVSRSLAPFALRVLWLLGPALVVAGWFYARNLMLYGQPLVGNWSSTEPGRLWWSEPGFHTADYYLGFGESLARPFLAGFTSFWDALYSTAWGDGLLAGQGGIRARHASWNYEWMAAGYLLAVPATLLLMLGFAMACREVITGPDAARRGAYAAIVALCGAMAWSTFWVTLELPYFGQAKAFYSLALVPIASLFFVQAFRRVDEWLGARGGSLARAALFGWFAALVGSVCLSFAA